MRFKSCIQNFLTGLALLLTSQLLWADDNQRNCEFDANKIAINMPRSKVEALVATWLKKTNNYNVYSKNLEAKKVRYQSKTCRLTITFAAGSPAPWVINKDGIGEHLEPIEQTVLDFKITKTNKTTN